MGIVPSSGSLPEQRRSGVSDADAAGAILEAAARPIQPKPRPTNESAGCYMLLQEINMPAMSDLENHFLTDVCWEKMGELILLPASVCR